MLQKLVEQIIKNEFVAFNEVAPNPNEDPLTAMSNAGSSQPTPGDTPDPSNPLASTEPTTPTDNPLDGTDDEKKGEEEDKPKNSLEDIISQAQELSSQTKDAPTILKMIKTGLQTNRELRPSEILKKLEDTNDSTLKQVSTRLKHFLLIKP